MAKQDVITAALAAITQAQNDAITEQVGNAYDQGAADQKVTDANSAAGGPNAGGLTQSDVDAAVAAQSQQDQQALAQAKAAAQTALADVQSKLDAMTTKEQAEEEVIGGLQSSLNAASDAIAKVYALIPSAQPVQPAPVQDPTTVQPTDPSTVAPAPAPTADPVNSDVAPADPSAPAVAPAVAPAAPIADSSK